MLCFIHQRPRWRPGNPQRQNSRSNAQPIQSRLVALAIAESWCAGRDGYW